MKKTFYIAFLLIFVIGVGTLYSQNNPPTDKNPTKLERLINPLLDILLQPERVIETIKPNIKPDTTILDVGAGIGYFTFRFARALQGNGKIFATEIDPAMLEQIQKRIKDEQITNIYPVLVSAQGIDPFYQTRKFDIIFMSKVYSYLTNPEDYLKGLRPSLADNGSLYIINPKNINKFIKELLLTPPQLLQSFADKGDDYPFFARLDNKTKHFIRNWNGLEIPIEITNALVASLEKMVSYPLLYSDLSAYYYRRGEGKKLWEKNIGPMDLSLANWLITELNFAGAFDKNKPLGKTELRELRMLNRLLILGTFSHEKPGSYQESKAFYAEKETIIATVQKAGFKFWREYDLLPDYYFLEFRGNDQRKGSTVDK